MRDLVIDASVAVKWISPDEPSSDRATLMLMDYRRGQVSFLVPLFWQYEIANSINKAVERGRLSEEEGNGALEALLSLGVRLEPFPPPRASYSLARRFQRSVYDSLYLEVAERCGCEFWTGDLKLYNAAKVRHPFVHWIGNYRTRQETGGEQ